MGSPSHEDFAGWVTADGSSGFKAEAGRYHLYVAFGCPFAHRAIIARSLKGLEDAISMSSVHWHLDKQTGWRFTDEYPDPLFGASFLRDIYEKARPGYNGRITVPVLWDKQTKTIVSTSSADILRMLATEFDAFSATPKGAISARTAATIPASPPAHPHLCRARAGSLPQGSPRRNRRDERIRAKGDQFRRVHVRFRHRAVGL